MPSKKIRIAGKPVVLDARPDRLDLRDLPYRPRLAALPEVYPAAEVIQHHLPAYSKAGLILDQGNEGACTGFGLAAVINYQLWLRSGQSTRDVIRVSPFMLYQLARFYDEWPGEDYEGSSCRGALKGWHRHGVCNEKLWAKPQRRPLANWDIDAVKRPLGVYYRIDIQSVVDIQAAIYETGAVYVSADVHAGWDLDTGKQTRNITHASLPVIQKKRVDGGHSFALVGYNARGFIVQNSWGPGWGAGGFAVLSYEDWIANAADAWAVALGVPVELQIAGEQAFRSPKHYVRSVPSANTLSGGRAGLGITSDRSVTGTMWSTETAYEHTLVTGNDGRVINRLAHLPDAKDAVQYVCFDQPELWIKQRKQHRKIALYAHGGLNSESASITRNQVLGEIFQANDVYPLFTTWRSGPFETIGSMLGDYLREIFAGRMAPATGLGAYLSERTDRMLEGACRHLLVKAMWSEMKENVARGQQNGHGLAAIAEKLVQLKQTHGIEIHLVGHSAGAFVCGRLLQEIGRLGSTVDSCTLYAPACDLDFANQFYASAVTNKVLAGAAFNIHLLADERELDDTVGEIYRKSLLYLVSRALESQHKTPLLGMQSAFIKNRATKEYWHEDTLHALRAWQAFCGAAESPRLHTLDSKEVAVTLDEKRIKSSHGCFDNSIDVIQATLQRITGNAPLKTAVIDLDY